MVLTYHPQNYHFLLVYCNSTNDLATSVSWFLLFLLSCIFSVLWLVNLMRLFFRWWLVVVRMHQLLQLLIIELENLKPNFLTRLNYVSLLFLCVFLLWCGIPHLWMIQLLYLKFHIFTCLDSSRRNWGCERAFWTN